MPVARTLHERFTRRETLKPRIDHPCTEYRRPGMGGNTLIRTSGTGCSALYFSRRCRPFRAHEGPNQACSQRDPGQRETSEGDLRAR